LVVSSIWLSSQASSFPNDPTWFEYAPADAEAFEELVGILRRTEEWPLLREKSISVLLPIAKSIKVFSIMFKSMVVLKNTGHCARYVSGIFNN